MKARHALCLLAGCFAAAGAAAESLRVLASDREGRPLADAVIWVVVPNHGVKPPREPAIIRQRDLVFDPFVLPVMAGTPVVFPNNDRVAHHLKSFSLANEFEFPVYEPGTTTVPLIFEKPGSTALYCYFHLSMRGFVYVVDTPHFGRTDTSGLVRIEGIPRGEFEVRGWHPDWPRAPLEQRLRFEGETIGAMNFDLKPRQRPVPRTASAAGVR